MQLKFGCSTSEDHQFVRGLPIYTISEVLDKIISGANGPPLLINGVQRPMPLVRILEVELYPTLLSKARSFGLSDNWVQVCLYPFYSLYFKQLISFYPLLDFRNLAMLILYLEILPSLGARCVICIMEYEVSCDSRLLHIFRWSILPLLYFNITTTPF